MWTWLPLSEVNCDSSCSATPEKSRTRPSGVTPARTASPTLGQIGRRGRVEVGQAQHQAARGHRRRDRDLVPLDPAEHEVVAHARDRAVHRRVDRRARRRADVEGRRLGARAIAPVGLLDVEGPRCLQRHPRGVVDGVEGDGRDALRIDRDVHLHAVGPRDDHIGRAGARAEVRRGHRRGQGAGLRRDVLLADAEDEREDRDDDDGDRRHDEGTRIAAELAPSPVGPTALELPSVERRHRAGE